MIDKSLFWQYACKCYTVPDIQQALLTLQDKKNKNVNLCLLLMYLESLNIQLNEQQLSHLCDIAEQLDATLLKPHRAVRATLKEHHLDHPLYGETRQAMLNSELALEALQQASFVSTLNQFALSKKNNVDNLSLYLSDTDSKTLR